MRNYLKILVGLVAVLIRVGEARAQLDNSAFVPRKWYSPDQNWVDVEQEGFENGNIRVHHASRPTDRRLAGRDEGAIYVGLNSFTFFKDNEYFNKIVDGYTLFGTQLNPQLIYYPLPELRLEAGVFLWKDFGNPVLKQIRPTYRATYTVGRNQFILGNIHSTLSHGYIEPLFNFERVMLNPLEEGLQYRLNADRVSLDIWVDWQRQQYRYSNYQEEIAGGVSSSIRLTGKNGNSPWQVAIPLQFTATHHGGQIDTLDKPLQTLFNEAAGIEVRRFFDDFRWKALRFNGYVLGFQDNSPTKGQLPFQQGNGFYLNTTLETRYADVMLSYWQGSRFIAPLGGDLYQSLSRTVSDPNAIDRNRQILLLRLLRDFRISDAAALTVRVEPLYDFNAKLLDFSFGVYLNFRQEWWLGNVARRARTGQ